MRVVSRFALPLALAGAVVTLATPALATSAAEQAVKLYKLEGGAAIQVKKGQKGTARVAVVPSAKDAYVHPDSPFWVTATSGGALELPQAKLGKKEAKRESKTGPVAFEIPYVGKVAGKDQLKASLDFFICHEKLCERQRREITFAVVVE